MPFERKNIVLVGAGNVSHHLGNAFKRSGNKILKLINRTEETGERLAFELGCKFGANLKEIPAETDVILIAVKDDAVAEVASNIRCHGTIVAHTSGSVPMLVLENCSDRIGVFYPLQTMQKSVESNMKEVPFCIEGNSKWNEGILVELGRCISENVQILSSEQRKAVHLAAVFACNFTNHFYALSEVILKNSGMEFDILKPLISKTAQNILTQSPMALQTGPAKRNDTQVMQEHLQLLENLSPELKKLYADVSESIIKMP